MKHSLLILILIAIGSARAQTVQRDTVYLQLDTDSVVLLQQVTVKGSRTPVTNSRYSDLSPVELVTTGGANGNLYAALQTLPGTQVEGESGKLLVRGGSSDETQTYIDGLHVLSPYASTGINTPTRGRFSPFMFSGIQLSTGGAPLEYGEALSAVLPLETKDRSVINKLGLNASVVGIGGGGTHAFEKSSLSLNIDLQDLHLYERLFPSRRRFEQPYRKQSGETQFRWHPTDSTLLKCYAAYSRTDFSNYPTDTPRLFSLGENNFYLNATFRHTTSGGWKWYAGIAYSLLDQAVAGATISDDTYRQRREEWHLKAKITRSFSPRMHVEVGAESFLRNFRTVYRAPNIPPTAQQVRPVLTALFASAAYRVWEQLKIEGALRSQYTAPNGQLLLSPRFAVSYDLGGTVLSLSTGRYTQLPDGFFLLQSSDLQNQTCVQWNFGIGREHDGRLYKLELYTKRYRRLPRWETQEMLVSDGYGHSRGIDLFVRDGVTLKNIEYQLSYTYNHSRRYYLDDPEPGVPQYATRHNAALTVKYSLQPLGMLIGLTNRFATGRPYHNPARAGWMNDEVKPYHTLDLGWTFIPSRKLILHASATNILGRRNLFGRDGNGRPIQSSEDRFFYVGCFLTIGKKAAYDVSNF
ncbi:MAG: TonB-dependent receptor plug domain-containing protein [Prevotellaceae bacterium]|jgi:outer membrane receptor for ferrienterochelin and colicin|nr:TonB-dependent receptor plug domain-containing protein [Prevotellaceae bacterium]